MLWTYLVCCLSVYPNGYGLHQFVKVCSWIGRCVCLHAGTVHLLLHCQCEVLPLVCQFAVVT